MENSGACVPSSLDEFLAAILGDRDPKSAAAFAAAILREYAPDEPRDQKGRSTAAVSYDDWLNAIAYGVSEPFDAFAADILGEHNFNPNQPRDERGRWTTGGSHDDWQNAIAFAVPGTSGTSAPGTSAEPVNRVEPVGRAASQAHQGPIDVAKLVRDLGDKDWKIRNAARQALLDAQPTNELLDSLASYFISFHEKGTNAEEQFAIRGVLSHHMLSFLQFSGEGEALFAPAALPAVRSFRSESMAKAALQNALSEIDADMPETLGKLGPNLARYLGFSKGNTVRVSIDSGVYTVVSSALLRAANQYPRDQLALGLSLTYSGFKDGMVRGQYWIYFECEDEEDMDMIAQGMIAGSGTIELMRGKAK